MENEHNWELRGWEVPPISLYDVFKIEFEYYCKHCDGEKIETFRGDFARKEYERLVKSGVVAQ